MKRVVGVFIFSVGIGIILLYTSSVVFTKDTDIKIRLRQNSENVSIAAKPEASSTSPLQIYKNGSVYGIELVNTDHPAATKARINFSSGEKALKRYCGKPWYSGFGTYSGGVYTFTDWYERSLVNCWVEACGVKAGGTTCYPTSCPVSLTPYWIISSSSQDGTIRADTVTANKVCEMQGYSRARSFSGSRTHSYSSPGNNRDAYWNGSKWVTVSAAEYNYHIVGLQCDCN